jgi:hypothetical protein
LEVAHNVKGIAIQADQFEFYFLHCSKYSGTFRNSQLTSLRILRTCSKLFES